MYGGIDPARNFAKVTLPTGYDENALSLTLSSGEGQEFPDPAIDGEFNLIWWNALQYPDPADDPFVEIVRCTARAGDVLTIQRAQEGTLAVPHNTPGGSYNIMLGFTKKMYDDLVTLERPIGPLLYSSSVAVNAGSSDDMSTPAISTGKTGKLAQVTLSSSVACKWVIKTAEGAVESTIDTVFTAGLTGNPTVLWAPVHQDYVPLDGGAGNVFRVTATNLDAKFAATMYATFWWDEVI
jgi:hypothetical protein